MLNAGADEVDHLRFSIGLDILLGKVSQIRGISAGFHIAVILHPGLLGLLVDRVRVAAADGEVELSFRSGLRGPAILNPPVALNTCRAVAVFDVECVFP